MISRLGLAVAVAALAGCSSPKRAPTSAAAPGAVRDADCVSACAAEYPAAPDPAAYAAYCEAVCTEGDEPNPTCASGCQASHGPGAYLDDDGEYREHEDERDDEQRAADDAACDEECARIPTIEPSLLAGCVDACVAGDRTEESCQVACDPDPYDECRYLPCD